MPATLFSVARAVKSFSRSGPYSYATSRLHITSHKNKMQPKGCIKRRLSLFWVPHPWFSKGAGLDPTLVGKPPTSLGKDLYADNRSCPVQIRSYESIVIRRSVVDRLGVHACFGSKCNPQGFRWTGIVCFGSGLQYGY